MSLLGRPPIRIGRAQREQRDDRVFVIATEDEYAPYQYFRALNFPRAKVFVVPTRDGLSAPEHVFDRLKRAYETARDLKEAQPDDEFWLLLDTDHWVEGAHRQGLLEALRQARQSGFRSAISNPCFELWLLLHHQEVPRGAPVGPCEAVGGMVRQALGAYQKTNIEPARFPAERIPDAIRRARALEANPDDPEAYWPANPGTRVYLLLEAILGAQNR